jgi:hypothetical protein
MGLHQKITDQNTAEPCDCTSDDDHSAVLMDNPEAIQAMVDEGSAAADELTKMRQEDFPAEPAEDVWTDGSE